MNTTSEVAMKQDGCHVCGFPLFKDYPGQTLFVVGGSQVHGRCWRWEKTGDGRLVRATKHPDELEMLYRVPAWTKEEGRE